MGPVSSGNNSDNLPSRYSEASPNFLLRNSAQRGQPANFQNIGLAQFCRWNAHALTLGDLEAPLPDRILRVVSRGAREEMFGVCATRVVAAMADYVSDWDFTNKQAINDSVNEGAGSPKNRNRKALYNAIAVSISIGYPLKTVAIRSQVSRDSVECLIDIVHLIQISSR